MPRLLGAIHQPAPDAVPHLSARAALSRMTAPASADWHAKMPADADALGNDAIGNCVPCAASRSIQMRRVNAWGDTWKPTADLTETLYRKWAAWDGTAATDLGTDTAAAMMAWANQGIRAPADSQSLDIPWWCQVAPTNVDHVKLAIATTGPVQVTLAMPNAWQEHEDVWDVPSSGLDSPSGQPGGWGSHRVCSGRYDADGTMWVLSWGIYIPVTPQAWAAYTLAVDVTLSRDWLNATGLSPAGLDLLALQSDMAALAGGGAVV